MVAHERHRRREPEEFGRRHYVTLREQQQGRHCERYPGAERKRRADHGERSEQCRAGDARDHVADADQCSFAQRDQHAESRHN
jgi:hypothetical protein